MLNTRVKQLLVAALVDAVTKGDWAYAKKLVADPVIGRGRANPSHLRNRPPARAAKVINHNTEA